jgi:hypothetical protein
MMLSRGCKHYIYLLLMFNTKEFAKGLAKNRGKFLLITCWELNSQLVKIICKRFSQRKRENFIDICQTCWELNSQLEKIIHKRFSQKKRKKLLIICQTCWEWNFQLVKIVCHKV